MTYRAWFSAVVLALVVLGTRSADAYHYCPTFLARVAGV